MSKKCPNNSPNKTNKKPDYVTTGTGERVECAEQSQVAIFTCEDDEESLVTLRLNGGKRYALSLDAAREIATQLLEARAELLPHECELCGGPVEEVLITDQSSN